MSSDSAIEWVVGAADAPVRLDRFLTARGSLGTRSQVRRLIDGERVRVEDRIAKAGTVLRVGQTVRIEPAEAVPLPDSSPRAESIELDVLLEDEWLLAINKPAGLVVHPAPGHWQGTLVNALLHRWQMPDRDLDASRMGIVHRLDKDTSGVLLVAKDLKTLEALARQFREREIDKTYVALVCGRVAGASGVIRKPIARHPVHRKRMAVRERGREAVTRWRVVERFDRMTLLRLFPETGRTHQLRVHLAAIGYPIAADATYGRRRSERVPGLDRQALHAESISFRHPVQGQIVEVRAPLARDIREAIAALRERGSSR